MSALIEPIELTPTIAKAKAEAAGPPWICSDCNLSRDKPDKRMPKGWKRRDDGGLFCADCWKKRYILRAIALPIIEPLDTSWEDLRKGIKLLWIESTKAANWMMSELYARDVRRTGEEQMPKMAKQYLYPEARKKFPLLPPTSVAALEQAVTGKYRAKRRDVIWTNAASLPTHRYPTPFALPNQAWSVSVENERPVVNFCVYSGESRFRMRLKGGARFHRQLKVLRLIERGDAAQGELAIYQKGKHLMCKMVAWVPREKRADVPAGDNKPVVQAGTLVVRTAPDLLLAGFNAKDERLWFYNADQLVRWTAEHGKQLQRWSEDQKAEQRPVPAFAERRAEAAKRFHRRMNTASDEISAMLVNYAKRRRFAALTYDDTERGYLPQFQWFQLAQLIERKCDEAGIEFVALGKASAEADTEEAATDAD